MANPENPRSSIIVNSMLLFFNLIGKSSLMFSSSVYFIIDTFLSALLMIICL